MPFGAILGAVAGPIINGIFGGNSSPSPSPSPAPSQNTGAAVGGAVGNVLIGQAGANAANTAANQQLTARSGSINTINAAGGQQQALLTPYINSGVDATNKLNQVVGGIDPNSIAKPFTMADATNSDAETYARTQALGAINNAASVGGTQLSSGNWDALMKSAAGIGSQFQNQAFQQNLASKEFDSGLLRGQASSGQAAAGSLASIVGNNANNVAGYQSGIGDVQAAGTIGAQEALSGGYSAAANNILGGASSALGSAGTAIGGLLGMNGQPVTGGNDPGVLDSTAPVYNNVQNPTQLYGGGQTNNYWSGGSSQIPMGG